MTDLHDKARALLALSSEATPAPWALGRHGHGDAPWLIRPAVAYEIENGDDAAFMCAAHNMADTIRDLLAENERLTAERAQVYAAGVSDGRNGTPCEAIRMQQEIDELRARAEAAEAELKAQVQCTLQALNQRQAVEARYAALCEAEPVAWGLAAEIDGQGWVLQHPVRLRLHDVEKDRKMYAPHTVLRTIALIHRPSMEVPRG